jgi:hypothetical protein
VETRYHVQSTNRDTNISNSKFFEMKRRFHYKNYQNNTFRKAFVFELIFTVEKLRQHCNWFYMEMNLSFRISKSYRQHLSLADPGNRPTRPSWEREWLEAVGATTLCLHRLIHSLSCLQHARQYVFASSQNGCALTRSLLFRRMTGSRTFSQGVSFSGSASPMPLRYVLLSSINSLES